MEKWLKEVQIEMLESIKDQTRKAYEIYFEEDRKSWVLDWPGQVVTAVSCMTWTVEVNYLFFMKKNINIVI